MKIINYIGLDGRETSKPKFVQVAIGGSGGGSRMTGWTVEFFLDSEGSIWKLDTQYQEKVYTYTWYQIS